MLNFQNEKSKVQGTLSQGPTNGSLAAKSSNTESKPADTLIYNSEVSKYYLRDISM